MKYGKFASIICMFILFLGACNDEKLPNQEMIDLLASIDQYEHNQANGFSPEAVVEYANSLLNGSLMVTRTFLCCVAAGKESLETSQIRCGTTARALLQMLLKQAKWPVT